MTGLRFHHARDLEHAVYGVVGARPVSELIGRSCGDADRCSWQDDYHEQLHWDTSYRWLAERVGFWPAFLAVGEDEMARRMTGYQNQWRRVVSWSREGNEYVKPGEFTNRVLFSWRDAPHPDVRFSDYDAWHIALNWQLGSVDRRCVDIPGPQLSAWEERLILKPSWSDARWLRAARSGSHDVQAVVPELDLTTADEIWCRSQQTRRELIRRGFDAERIVVRRLPINAW